MDAWSRAIRLAVDRLHTDTRTLAAGDCFVALQGDRFDGHEFVRQVRRHGAVAAVASSARCPICRATSAWSRCRTRSRRCSISLTYRSLLSVRTIGVTGSSGKTSTKELIAAVLRTRYKTKATEGNLNNHIGVPLTLIRLDEDDEYGVIEMGMNHPGEIAPLAAMTAPTIGVISSIGPAHIEFFSGMAAIAEEKAALLAAPASRRRGGVESRRRMERGIAPCPPGSSGSVPLPTPPGARKICKSPPGASLLICAMRLNRSRCGCRFIIA